MLGFKSRVDFIILSNFDVLEKQKKNTMTMEG